MSFLILHLDTYYAVTDWNRENLTKFWRINQNRQIKHIYENTKVALKNPRNGSKYGIFVNTHPYSSVLARSSSIYVSGPCLLQLALRSIPPRRLRAHWSQLPLSRQRAAAVDTLTPSDLPHSVDAWNQGRESCDQTKQECMLAYSYMWSLYHVSIKKISQSSDTLAIYQVFHYVCGSTCLFRYVYQYNNCLLYTSPSPRD